MFGVLPVHERPAYKCHRCSYMQLLSLLLKFQLLYLLPKFQL